MRSNQTIKYFSSYIKKTQDLSLREKTVLLRRLQEKTHIAIGKRWNVTEGRIRQIERAGLTKIKSKIHQLNLFK